jgi:hypothetical protein
MGESEPWKPRQATQSVEISPPGKTRILTTFPIPQKPRAANLFDFSPYNSFPIHTLRLSIAKSGSCGPQHDWT